MAIKKNPAVKTTTKVRNTAIPKTTTEVTRKELTHDMIAQRAYEIHCAGGGGEMENWLQAERELKGL